MQQDSLREALAALESVRLESVRLRRRVLDLIYNLDEENMPAVIERIKRTERALAQECEKTALLFLGEGKDATVNGKVLVQTINDEGAALSPATLSLVEEESKSDAQMSGAGLALRRTETHLPRNYEYTSALSPAQLEMKAEDGGAVSGGEKLVLTPRKLCMPYLRRNPQSSTTGLYPLYVDKDGNFVASYP